MEICDNDVLAWPDLALGEAIGILEAEGFAVVGGPVGQEPVAALVALLVAAVGGLYPAWLPEAAGIEDASGAGEPAVRAIAREVAAQTELFGPFLEAMAASALREGRRATVSGFAPQTVVRECVALVGRSYGGCPVAVVLEGMHAIAPGDERDLEWLADFGGFSLRLVGEAAGRASQMRTVRRRPRDDRRPAQTAERYITPLSGRPSPLSEAENRLEAFIASRDWAAGRRWNHAVDPGPLAPSMRVDLLWQDARCVVEIDGPEHATRGRYADDRRRDRLLQRMGYTVLRFTNEEVLEDVQRVAEEIGSFIALRRLNGER